MVQVQFLLHHFGQVKIIINIIVGVAYVTPSILKFKKTMETPKRIVVYAFCNKTDKLVNTFPNYYSFTTYYGKVTDTESDLMLKNDIRLIKTVLEEQYKSPSYKKKILYVDLDGVIADFGKRYKEIDNETALGQFVRQGETHDDLAKRQSRVTDVVMQYPEFFQSLPVIEGGYEAVMELSKHFDLYFLTTPMEEIYHSYSGKKEWLDETFGQEFVGKRLIITHRKDLAIGDYLIDDRVKNGAGEFVGEHILFGGEKYPDWKSVVEYLKDKA